MAVSFSGCSDLCSLYPYPAPTAKLQDTDCGSDDEWDWELIEIKSDHFLWLSQSDPFSGAVSFPTAQPYQDGWGKGPGEEVSSGGRVVMGEESAEGHLSWYCCQKKCSLNHSAVACLAKSCGSSQCQGHNFAFQPSVLWCHLFSSQCVWQLFGTVVRHGIVGAEKGSAGW